MSACCLRRIAGLLVVGCPCICGCGSVTCGRPLVVIAAPIDGDRLIQVDAEVWQERVRAEFLGGASEVRWVELWPDHIAASRHSPIATQLARADAKPRASVAKKMPLRRDKEARDAC